MMPCLKPFVLMFTACMAVSILPACGEDSETDNTTPNTTATSNGTSGNSSNGTTASNTTTTTSNATTATSNGTDPCPDECDEGAKRCADLSTLETCKTVVDDCRFWESSPCGGNAACVEDQAECVAYPSPCHDLEQLGDVVDVVQVAEEIPEAVGGTLVDGVYTLVDASVYTGPDGETGLFTPLPSAQSTIRISGNTIAFFDINDASLDATSTAEFTTDGSSIALTRVCPIDGTASPFVSYSVLEDGLRLYRGRTLVFRFEPQP